MSPILDSLAVCLGAVSALRAALCVEEGLRYPTFTALLRHLPWQSHALNVIACLGTVIYALAGGSREVLVASVLILLAGACVPLVVGPLQGAQQ
ncbi:hypothetical protein [Curvibacter delicatus]|uniref:hypothetical protein n=1 Tax=Curvibacter delicatus TaxID=80879 RepID=UPI00082E8E89|nr:hypothetical protein [Curvibacter delicatus]